MRRSISLLAALAALSAIPARAQDGLEIIGKPTERGSGFQPAVTELARDIQWLDGMVNVIIAAIVALVVVLMAVCVIRYNRRANPNPARFTHNSPIEVAWTIIPIVILVFIGAFSLPVLFKQQEIPEGDVYIKAIGNQWFWEYEYPEHDFIFASYQLGHPATLTAEDEAAGARAFVLNEAMEGLLARHGYSREEWLLATNTAVVVPVNKTIVMHITGADVIHAWTIPAFGVKQDAVPGRIAQLWFKAEKEGVYFGQCSELCGKDHAYMPITVKVVSEEAYEEWLKGAIDEYAGTPLAYDVALAE